MTEKIKFMIPKQRRTEKNHKNQVRAKAGSCGAKCCKTWEQERAKYFLQCGPIRKNVRICPHSEKEVANAHNVRNILVRVYWQSSLFLSYRFFSYILGW